MSVWRRITPTRPKVGEEVDIWVVPPESESGSVGFRVTNCVRMARYKWTDKRGKCVTGRTFYDEAGRRWFDPHDASADAWRAVAWMPRPKPPMQKEEQK